MLETHCIIQCTSLAGFLPFSVHSIEGDDDIGHNPQKREGIHAPVMAFPFCCPGRLFLPSALQSICNGQVFNQLVACHTRTPLWKRENESKQKGLKTCHAIICEMKWQWSKHQTNFPTAGPEVPGVSEAHPHTLFFVELFNSLRKREPLPGEFFAFSYVDATLKTLQISSVSFRIPESMTLCYQLWIASK